MSKYQYKLEPRTYRTMLRVLDEFYDWCAEKQLTPTLVRFEKYAEMGKNQYAELAPKPKGDSK